MTSTDIAAVVEGHGGLPKVRVSSPIASGEMYLHGGQVTAWSPAGAGEVLFVSNAGRWVDGRPIRGGVPVCFPWFGGRAGDPQAPAHGFVRTKAWQLESIAEQNGAVTVTMSTASTDDTRRWWPADFRLVHRATFGSTLTLELAVTNTGGSPLGFEAALHSYYRVGSVDVVQIGGLDGIRYLDTVGPVTEKTQAGNIAIVSETDRIYLDTRAPIDIMDSGLRRRIRVAAEHARTAVVWNPWVAKARALPDLGDNEWKQFVCVETCNVGPYAVDLAPGHEHTMRMIVSVDGLV